MLLANYAFSNSFQQSVGFTVGWAKRFGVYASMMTNGDFVMQTDHTLVLNDQNSNQYLWNGESSKTRFMVSVGGLYAQSDLGYLYAGVGYGVRNLIWYTISEQTVCISPGSCRGLALEGGMMLNIKNVLVAVGGLVQPSGKYYEFKLGLGYRF